MISEPSSALSYARTHRQRFVEELKKLVRFPTVSAQPRYARDIQNCAVWLAAHLRRIGLERAEVVPTPGHPIVFGAWRGAVERPTVLIYGHYDVQPPDPLRDWRSPPFEPAVRGNDLFGRGASDDKGQVWANVKALEAYLQTSGELPVNVRLVIEGEEEIGGAHLAAFLKRNSAALACDIAMLSDTTIPAPNRPAITYGTRGRLSLELIVHGPRQDLHSGNFGGAIHNPLQALCEIIAKLHDSEGRVAIPGFYDVIRRPGRIERARLACSGPSDAQLLRSAGAGAGWGEMGYSLYERISIRPALTINGLSGGYQGPGKKDVIPSSAKARLSFRLTPAQDPREIDRLFRLHIARITPPALRTTVRTISGAKPSLMNPKHPAFRAAALAYRKGFGVPPVFLRSGGTISLVGRLREVFNVPVVLLGFGLPDDHQHAPNEKLHLPNFYNGIATSIWFLNALAGASLPERPAEREALDAVLAM